MVPGDLLRILFEISELITKRFYIPHSKESDLIAVIIDTIRDSVLIFPFLFAAYFLLEFMEWKSSQHSIAWITKSSRLGPVIGSVLGIIPQCGFSAVSSEFYTHRIITLGTLISIYLSTSDEMLPILLAEKAAASTILRILLIKAAIGMIYGFLIDLVVTKRHVSHESAECAIHRAKKAADKKFSLKKTLMDALHHSLQVFLFLFLVTLALNGVIAVIGEENLSHLFINRPVIGELLAALVGLIPNCAGSVIVTELYLSGAIGSGAVLAGLLSAAGIGPLMLFRINKHRKENILILVLLYGISAATGILFTLLGVVI